MHLQQQATSLPWVLQALRKLYRQNRTLFRPESVYETLSGPGAACEYEDVVNCLVDLAMSKQPIILFKFQIYCPECDDGTTKVFRTALEIKEAVDKGIKCSNFGHFFRPEFEDFTPNFEFSELASSALQEDDEESKKKYEDAWCCSA
jgi:hypothetical protein